MVVAERDERTGQATDPCPVARERSNPNHTFGEDHRQTALHTSLSATTTAAALFSTPSSATPHTRLPAMPPKKQPQGSSSKVKEDKVCLSSQCIFSQADGTSLTRI